MQILMELIGAGILIFLVVKGVQAVLPKQEEPEKTEPTKTTQEQK